MPEKEFLKNILVAVDDSASSLMALETAAAIAKYTDATVNVLHVVPHALYQWGERLYSITGNVSEEILAKIEQDGERIVNGAVALFNEEGVKVNTDTLRGDDPAEGILEHSQGNCDLIVMGAHGENEKDPHALGSTTKKVMTHTQCPVLIVKAVTPAKRLLICTDGSDESIRAAKYGARLAEKAHSGVTVLHVQDQQLYKASPDISQKLGKRILSDTLSSLNWEGTKLEERLEVGVPSDVIVDVARKEGHDLIVLGKRGMGRVRRFILGSVSDDVGNKAKCSVLIVPARRELGEHTEIV